MRNIIINTSSIPHWHIADALNDAAGRLQHLLKEDDEVSELTHQITAQRDDDGYIATMTAVVRRSGKLY